MSTDDYQRLLVLKLESVGEGHLIAYENIKWNKENVAQRYNKHVHNKEFGEGELVWKEMFY